MSGHHRCLASQVLKYYLVMVDDFTHYCWAFPLRHKSEVHRHIVEFVAYAHTQFSLSVKCFQADNGTEFINNATSTFLASRGVLLAPRAPIPPHRTARLNGCCAHSTTWCTPSCFMLLCLPPTGWRHWRPPFSCSTCGPPHPSVTVYHIISCIALCQTIPLFEFLAACATQTLVPRHLTNWLHALLLACSSVIPP